MSGHSKWHNIAAKKGKADSQRGKIFTKIGREILIAVKAGGADSNSNSKLRDIIAKAKANNMPNDTISNSIKKAEGAGNTENYEEVVYEGYGPNGIAVIVEGTTDNRNRTAGEVRHLFDKFGGNLGTTGCVSYLFNRKGVIVIAKENCKISEDDIMLLAIDSGAEDFEATEEYYEITTSPENFSQTREKLEGIGMEFEEAEIQMVPATYTQVDEKGAERMQKLVDALEELDDVSEVYHNWAE